MSVTRIDLEARELEEIGYTYQECREFQVWLSIQPPLASSALCLLATIMIDHIRIPDPEDIDGSGEDIFVIDRHRSDLSETVMRSLLNGDFKDG